MNDNSNQRGSRHARQNLIVIDHPTTLHQSGAERFQPQNCSQREQVLHGFPNLPPCLQHITPLNRPRKLIIARRTSAAVRCAVLCFVMLRCAVLCSVFVMSETATTAAATAVIVDMARVFTDPDPDAVVAEDRCRHWL